MFVHGDGLFQEGAVAAGLEMLLKTGSTTSGVVAPVVDVTLAQYQVDLAVTRNDWRIDES